MFPGAIRYDVPGQRFALPVFFAASGGGSGIRTGRAVRSQIVPVVIEAGEETHYLRNCRASEIPEN
jgi:hypothetical protein